jgi:uncharacterized protein
MPIDHLRYDLLTQDALRGVIRSVLTDAATKGLPGEHHFFITFDTRAEGVQMSPRLKAAHPQEMTIVLQHQFWDLKVTDDDFEVGLAFKGIPERLHVPLKAVKAFHDPSVQFGLQFTVEAEASAEAEPAAPALDRRKAKPAAKSDVNKSDAKPEFARPDAAKPELAKPEASEPKAEAKPEPKRGVGEGEANKAEKTKKDDGAGTSGEVVRLDRFRKK